MKATFTPGPYTVNVWSTGRKTVETHNGLVLAEVHITHVEGERRANADLFAASHGLLMACRVVMSRCTCEEASCGVCSTLKRAVDKVK